MDDAGGLRGGGADRDGPGARLLGAGGQVRLQAEGREADPSELVETGLVLADAKAKGWVRMEGKDYVMQDGDVVEFRFNV